MVRKKDKEKKKELKRKLGRIKKFEREQLASAKLIRGIVGTPEKKPERKVNILG